MATVQTLLGALEQEDTRPAERRARGVSVFAIALVILEYLLFLGLGLFSLWRAWSTARWDDFWISAPFMAIITLLPFLVWVIPTSMRAASVEKVRDGSRGLREVAATGDEHLAPLALLQPPALTDADTPTGPLRIGPLKQLPGTLTPIASQLLVIVAVTSFGLLVLVFMMPLSLDFGSPDIFNIPFIPFISVLPFFLFVPWIVILARRLRGRTIYVTADEHTLEWLLRGRGRGPGDTQRIAWDQVRSLSRVVHGLYSTSTDTSQNTTYIVDAPDAPFTWTVSPMANDEEFAASELLLRLIVTRTGKPLRDLSRVAAELAQAGGHAKRILARLPSTGAGASGLASIPIVSAPEKRSRRRMRAVGWVALGLVALLPAGLLLGGGTWLQSYQPQYFASIPARVHALTPVFHDDLLAEDGNWPVGQPTLDNPYGYAFVGDTYQLSGTKAGNFVVAHEPMQFGDAAYEVTATQSGVLPQDGGDGVGLELHASASDDSFVVFMVSFSGDWELSQYKYVDNRASDNWSWIDDGHSSAIHTASGQANRLLVVVRGGTYLLYINEQYVGSYTTSSYDHLPTYGYAGVYLDESAMLGTFTQFSVYPANPTTPWEYV